jgi:prolyl oligopeptidase
VESRKIHGFQKAGSHYFYFHNSGLQNQSVVYVMDSLDGTPRVLLDPNTYRTDGTAALTGESVSWNGKLFGYGVAQAGSDWTEWRVRGVSTGKDLSDLIQWTKGSGISWAEDGGGFYYSRFPQPPPEKMLTVAALDEKVYFHKLGDPQIGRQADLRAAGSSELDDRSAGDGGQPVSAALHVHRRSRQESARVSGSAGRECENGDADSVRRCRIYAHRVRFHAVSQTNDGAPRGRVIAMDMEHPERANWKEIVPERAETLDGAQMADGKLLLSYMKDAHSAARLVTWMARRARISRCRASGRAMVGARLQDKEMFYGFDGFTIAPSIYRLDLETERAP